MDRDSIRLHHPPHRDLHKMSMGSGRQHEDKEFFQENGEVPQEEEIEEAFNEEKSLNDILKRERMKCLEKVKNLFKKWNKS